MTPAKARVYAPVLAKMAELLGENPKLRFGVALDMALTDLEMRTVGDEDRTELLTAAFVVMSTGRIPGCPDA